MNLTEDELIKEIAKHYMHCTRNRILTYEYELTCVASGYSVVIKGTNLQNYSGQNIINRSEFAEKR